MAFRQVGEPFETSILTCIVSGVQRVKKSGFGNCSVTDADGASSPSTGESEPFSVAETNG